MRSISLGEHRGAENALNLPLRHATIKMCRDPRHTFIFHTPKGALHTPKACFMCRRHASFEKKSPAGRQGIFSYGSITLLSSSA